MPLPLPLARALVAVPLALSFIDLRKGGFRREYEREADRGLSRSRPSAPVVTDADLSLLPTPLAVYLRRVGIEGKPRAHHVEARWKTEMKTSRNGVFRSGHAEQIDFFDEPTRLFLMDQRFYGVATQAFHRYSGGAATMRVRVASAVDMVDARGPEMNQSETVTLFNDMCLLAPSSLIGADVVWREMGPHTVRGVFTQAGNTITADLIFDDCGDLVDFVSNDRFRSEDGKRYERLPWSTPVSVYRDFHGLRLPSHGEARWIERDGYFVYARFDLEDVTIDRPRTPASKSWGWRSLWRKALGRGDAEPALLASVFCC